MRFALALGAILFSFVAQAMVGGEIADANDPLVKSVVFIAFGESNRCTGVLVAKRFVLTANHCMEYPPQSYKVVFTTDVNAILERREKAVFRHVTGVHASPTFANRDPLSDDAVLIELDQDAPESARVAELPAAELQIPVGSKIRTFGFGLQNAAGVLSPLEPINLTSKVLETSQPEVPNYFGIQLDYHRLFVAQPEGGICLGDSGGPAFLLREGQTPVLVALNGATVPNFPKSYKSGEDICAANAYVSRVDTMVDWIHSLIVSGHPSL